jgi:hypothetical protein
MNGYRESDSPIVSEKPLNNTGDNKPVAEEVEKRGWYESTRLDWYLLHLSIIRRQLFSILTRLCHESLRGWLKTIRFAIHPLDPGME